MAFILADRVRETASAPGTSTVTLLGAVTGYQAFSAGIGANNTTYYVIADQSGNNWEVGLGTIGAGGTTLARTTVLSSSNSGSLVNFSSGTQDVFCDYTATKAIIADINGNITTNNLFEGFSNTVASGTQIVLTAASVPSYVITGSGGQTIKLPDATTLPNGTTFAFNNNQSSGAISVNNNSNTLVVSIPSGAFTIVTLLSNSIAAGSWDTHDQSPANVSWSTNTFSYAGSFTNGTWNGNTVAVNRGGTGASTLTGYVKGNGTSAMTASATIPSGDVSGLGTMSTQNANAVAITGGTIDNTVIGGTTPAAGTFTTITGQTEVLKGTGTNLFTQSSSLTNAAWGQVNVTLTGGQTDPFGGTTAVLMNSGTAASTQHYLAQNLTLSSNVFTFSFYAKAGTSNFIGIYSSNAGQGAFFNLTTGAFTNNMVGAPTSYSSVNAGGGWWRFSITITSATGGFWLVMSEDGINYTFTGTSKTAYVAAPQLEIGSVTNTYVSTTSAAVYGTPTLSFNGVAGLGLQSDGSLYVSPAGTGAIQAQATTSSTVGGNARGANAVDWQTSRSAASQVASAVASVISGGYAGQASGGYSVLCGGFGNTATGTAAFTGGGSGNGAGGSYAFVGGGGNNTANGTLAGIASGQNNTANGYYNFVGGGQLNSGTSGSAVTTQSATMNGTTAVTLSGSNASIKVGQYITGTSIGGDTYVAAVSGTSLTLSKIATGSSTSTLSFYTPHGVVVGGGNNQATGSYSFIGGGGDAGTAANRNTASGAWSAVVGGAKNVASGVSSFVGGGGTDGAGTYYANTASGTSSVISGGWNNNNSGGYGTIAGGQSNSVLNSLATVGGGTNNYASGYGSTVVGGTYGTTRAIVGNIVFPACGSPISSSIYGASQAALLVLGVETTNATATVLRSETNAASATNQVILPNNSAYYFTGEVISGVTGGGNTKGWEIAGVIKRGADAASTTLVGSTVTSLYADAGAATWTIALAADTTNGGLKVTFTGQASTTIRTVCQIRTTEMTY